MSRDTLIYLVKPTTLLNAYFLLFLNNLVIKEKNNVDFFHLNFFSINMLEKSTMIITFNCRILRSQTSNHGILYLDQLYNVK